MEFPTTADFLEAFGIEPIEEDLSMAFCRYSRKADDGQLEIDFSFSAVEESFQVVMRFAGNDVATISSERVKQIDLFTKDASAGVRVVFELAEATSEAVVTLVPEIRCHWWTLRN